MGCVVARCQQEGFPMSQPSPQEGEQASPPTYVSGVDWGLPGFGDTQITKNLQQLLAAGRTPH